MGQVNDDNGRTGTGGASAEEAGYISASNDSKPISPQSAAESTAFGSLRDWLNAEINNEQTLMQFTGYCLLTGKVFNEESPPDYP